MAVYYIFTGHDAHTLRAYPDPVRYLVLSAPLFLLYFFQCDLSSGLDALSSSSTSAELLDVIVNECTVHTADTPLDATFIKSSEHSGSGIVPAERSRGRESYIITQSAVHLEYPPVSCVRELMRELSRTSFRTLANHVTNSRVLVCCPHISHPP